jgi:uncharacterized protein (TIGR03083 family)
MTLAAHLSALRGRSEELADLIGTLTNGEWHQETNCPPWRVNDLSAHLVSSGRGFITSIERGLKGQTDPPPRSGTDLSAAEPQTVADALTEVTDRFEALYDGLSDSQLETVCFHRRGNRSIRWYAAHRLAEVAFHGWDLETSLGRPPRFEPEIARLLLPMLLESNVPRTYAAGLSLERGRGERYLLRVADDPALAWLVTINTDALDVRRVTPDEMDGEVPPTGGGQTQVENVPPIGGGLAISAAAGDLALLVYGRADLRSVANLDGDASLVERFARVFPRP